MEKTQDRSASSELQEPGGVLEELARKGARQLLAQAMEAEVAEFVEKYSGTTATGTCQSASWSRESDR
jgi:hypothetical protein